MSDFDRVCCKCAGSRDPTLHHASGRLPVGPDGPDMQVCEKRVWENGIARWDDHDKLAWSPVACMYKVRTERSRLKAGTAQNQVQKMFMPVISVGADG